MTGTRSPAVAGRFYAGSASALEEQIEAAFEHPVGPGSVPDVASGDDSLSGLVSPHAGYPYSGPVAAHGYAELARSGRPDGVILVGPNHTRFGEPIAISEADRWKTPLGTVPVDDTLRDQLADYRGITLDESTHQGEHSLEVQVPFLQYLYDNPVPILPIVMSQQDQSTVDQLVEALGAADTQLTDWVLVASTDLTHYEPAVTAERKDKPIREAIEALDPGSILQAIDSGHTMCGGAPTAAVLQAATNGGGTEAEVLTYATSGDTAGDTDSVVGYVSAVIR